MTDVYKNCPQFENKRYLLRLVCKEDRLDLLKVYSDKAAVPFFNSDNCGGDDFYYKNEARMEKAIDYWLFEYARKGFVRWSILEQKSGRQSEQSNFFIGIPMIILQIAVCLDWICEAIMKKQAK